MAQIINSRPKLIWISILQVIAMVMIVFSHSIPHNQNIAEVIKEASLRAVYIALPIFIWVSGYLSIKTNALEKYGYWSYLKKRFVRLIVPFVCITMLMLLPRYLLSAYSSKQVDLSLGSIYVSILFPRQGILPHLWFLPTLMLLTVLSPIIEAAIRRKLIGLISLIVAALLTFLPTVTNLLCLNDLKLYLFWYTLGFYMARHIIIGNVFKKYLTIISGGGYLLLMVLAPDYPAKIFITNVLAFICILGCLTLIEYANGHFWNHMSSKILTIYILSLPIQNIAEIICVRLGATSMLTFLSRFLAGIIIPSLIIEVVEFFEKKTSIKFVSKIIGM